MKFLVDAQLPRRLALAMLAQGHDARHTLDLPDANQTTDEQINTGVEAIGGQLEQLQAIRNLLDRYEGTLKEMQKGILLQKKDLEFVKICYELRDYFKGFSNDATPFVSKEFKILSNSSSENMWDIKFKTSNSQILFIKISINDGRDDPLMVATSENGWAFGTASLALMSKEYALVAEINKFAKEAKTFFQQRNQKGPVL